MANITISRQDYGTNEFNGWKPNTISGELLGSVTAGTSWTIPQPTSALTGTRGDTFKDHKTVFIVNNAQSAAVKLTLKGGDTYAGNMDVEFNAPVGTSVFWLDSSKFADKTTGAITITAASAVKIVGYEMR